MAVAIQYGALTSVVFSTTSLDALGAAGATTTSDNYATTAPAIRLECDIVGANASSAGTVDIYLMESLDG